MQLTAMPRRNGKSVSGGCGPWNASWPAGGIRKPRS